MKYLKSYYITEGHVEELDSLDDAVDWIRKYSLYTKDILPLYRTDMFEEKREYYILDPTKYGKDRYSPHGGSNFHNLLISNLPSWKNFPRRNKSIIFGNKSRGARHFGGGGNKYRLFPLKNADIGVVSGEFWKIKDDSDEDLPDIAKHIIHYLERKLQRDVSDKNWEELHQLIIDAEHVDDVDDIKTYLMKYGSHFFNFDKIRKYSVLEIIDNIFKSGKVELVKYNNDFTMQHFKKGFIHNFFYGDDIEFWTESPCLFVDMTFDDELQYKLN